MTSSPERSVASNNSMHLFTSPAQPSPVKELGSADGGFLSAQAAYLTTARQRGQLRTGQTDELPLAKLTMWPHLTLGGQEHEPYYVPERRKNQKYFMNSANGYHKESQLQKRAFPTHQFYSKINYSKH